MAQETFEFEADIACNEEIAEDVEEQIIKEVKERFGKDKSGDDVADYHYKLIVSVTVNK